MDLLLNKTTNDLFLANGELSLTTTIEEFTRQRVSVYLSTYKGEMFWSTRSGIPYLANDNNPIQILGKTTDKRFFDAYIQEGVLSRPGIVRIDKYNSEWDRARRVITIDFEATTETGDVITVSALSLGGE